MNQLSSHHIALFGEILADIFPDKVMLGGAPFNVARHLTAFNQQTTLISRAGNDDLRNQFLSEFSRLGMVTTGIQTDPIYPTGQVKITINGNGHHFDIKENQAYDHIHAGVTHLVTIAAHPQIAYFGTLAQRSIDSRLALDTFLSDAKCPRFLDVNLREPWYDKHTIRRSLLRSDIVKVNDEELSIITNYFMPGLTDVQAQAHYLLKHFDFHTLFITCGDKGAWVINNKGFETYVESTPESKQQVDTVGAGDGFSAVCIVGILEKWPVELMLKRANAFAGSICTIRGAIPSHQDFYANATSHWLS